MQNLTAAITEKQVNNICNFLPELTYQLVVTADAFSLLFLIETGHNKNQEERFAARP